MDDTERVRPELLDTRFGDIRFLPEVDSTMRYVGDAVAGGATPGLVVVADFQSAGRGRLGRTWEAPRGSALLMSILLDVADLAPPRRHLVTAAVGLSARDACAAVGGFTPDLKWPNDLLVGDRKLAGILAESSGADVVVGIGLNLSAAPPDAVCAEEAAGRPVERAPLVIALLRALDGWLGRWDAVADAYRSACSTVGRRVRVEQVGGDFEGVAEGLDEDGRLLVRVQKELKAIAAGDVVHLRSAEPR
ncbi:MAG: biotin--[acetyl-CoA-carboxylase] ligase [Acidimicrobiaceae bacterium]|nr:biotin--[acetyl-CoA-carboxylase] ligase [Acidimicrobiaceae bacterium]